MSEPLRQLPPADAESCTPLDAALGACDRAAEDALRARATEDPLLMLELAEEVAFFERCRELRVTPSARYDVMLRGVVRRAARRMPELVPVWRRPWFAVAAAAVVTFAALLALDPLQRPEQEDVVAAMARRPVADREGAADGVRAVESVPAPFAGALGAMRDRFELERSALLRDVVDEAMSPSDDLLERWLEPRNAVALMRVDHELRAQGDVRRSALRSQGALPGADQRVQELADELAIELPRRFAAVPFEPPPSMQTVAFTVRALLAAGPTSPLRAAAIDKGAAWLADRLPNAGTGDAVHGLAALVEAAAVYGEHAVAVREQGRRLLDSVLVPQMEWQRGRPELLGPAMAAGVVGEAARVLRFLPAFGLDEAGCGLVRNLLCGVLRERVAQGADSPEVFAAIVYGVADLLPESERFTFERRLRRWQPVHLAPDFVTVQQIAWGMQPKRSGFTRLQWQLRPLAALQRPQPMRERAGLALCLAANYAAPRGAFLQEVARAAAGS